MSDDGGTSRGEAENPKKCENSSGQTTTQTEFFSSSKLDKGSFNRHCAIAMADNSMGSLSMQGGPINCLGKVPPKRSVFPEYWRQTNRIRSESLRQRPSSPLTLSTHSRESFDRTMVIDTCTIRSIPKKITLPIALTTPPRNGSIQHKVPFLDSPSRITDPRMDSKILQVPRRCILPQRRIYTIPSIESEPEQSKSPRRLKTHDDRMVVYTPCSSPARSCMRESRFSGSPSPRRCSSFESEGSAVRFDLKKVDVVTFEKPQETYSRQGWSDQFTL